MMKKKLVTGALSAAMLVTLCVPRTLLTKAEITSHVLVCEKEEHTHSAECYGPSKELTCGLEETEGHKHDDSCYEVEEVLKCTLEGDENHAHSESCYTTKRTLVCPEEESAGHTHSDKCYKKELICGMEEHKHNKDCYETEIVEKTEETPGAEVSECTCGKEDGKHTEECPLYQEPETSGTEETTAPEAP